MVIPGSLSIIVSMDVDESRRNNLACCIDNTCCFAADRFCDGSDDAIFDSDIEASGVVASPIVSSVKDELPSLEESFGS